MAQKKSNEIDKVLVTRFSAVGDVAMVLPMLYSVARAYPDRQFVFVSRERFGQLLVNAPANITFAGIDLKEYSGILGLYKLYSDLKKEYAPDAIADLHDVLRTKVVRTLFSFSGCKVAVIDKGREEKRNLTDEKNNNKQQLKSTFERYRDVFSRLGMPFEPDFTSVFTDGKGDISDFSSFLPEKGGDRWIGVAPFARHQGKIYPTGKMRRVVELLAEKPGIKVFCFGNGDAENAIIDEWCNSMPNVYNFIGKTNFGGELRMIDNLDVMISMDSANMHIAALAGTPVVSIWGATSPLAGFLGWKIGENDCVQKELPCRPCSIFGDKQCRLGDYRCMDIAPETVVKKVLEKL